MSSRDYFEGVAAQWDAMRASFFPEAVRDRAIERANPQAGGLALDLGAGSGFMTEALLDHGLEVVAVDQSPAMLEALERRLGEGRVRTLLASGDEVPLPDGYVDYVFANMYLHHVADPSRALAEMHRLLRHGGRAVITDLDAHDFEFLRVEHHDRWLGFARSDLESWFGAAGFSSASVEDLGSTCEADAQGSDARASISIFIAVGER